MTATAARRRHYSFGTFGPFIEDFDLCNVDTQIRTILLEAEILLDLCHACKFADYKLLNKAIYHQ